MLTVELKMDRKFTLELSRLTLKPGRLYWRIFMHFCTRGTKCPVVLFLNNSNRNKTKNVSFFFFISKYLKAKEIE